MNYRLFDKDVVEFIHSNLNEDISRLILKGSPFSDVTIQELAQQLIGFQKAQNKLPSWFSNSEIYFPPKLNLEQTSSEATAAYKASLFTGSKAIDLTGGFGIDDYYLSKNFKQVTHCEINEELATIAAHNYNSLGAGNISVVTSDSLKYLEKTDAFYDLIYADPSRRSTSKGKVFMLKDCEPNIPDNLELLFKKTDTVVLKTSPLLDITAGLKELNYVAEIHVVAVKNEVKELLWVLKKDSAQQSIKLVAVNLDSDYATPVTLNIEAQNESFSAYAEPSMYLYEPNAALLKLGIFNWISAHYHLEKLAPNSHLYTSDKKIEFPGRVFKINATVPYSKKEISKLLKNKKAHITTRNFKESAPALRSKFKVLDGGDTYLFFTTLENNKSVMLSCSKLT